MLSTAYGVKFAVLANSVSDGDKFDESFLSKRDKPEVEGRTVRLVDASCFQPRPITQLSVNTKLEEFLSSVDPDRILQLLNWLKPQVAIDKKGVVHVLSAAPIVAMARYLAPVRSVRFECLSTPPVTQLSLSQCCDMYISVFQPLVAENRDVICRISASATEAALLTGCSESLAYEIRSKQGALNI
jgi:hypothetical protein